jgi:hypothetical protein
MLRTEKNVMGHKAARAAVLSAACALAGGAVLFAGENEAQAQEIQLTGPLAGAPAVRKLRLHRDGRFEVTPNVSFTLLDEYNRTIMPGLRLQYHFLDWLGIGVWGGYGFQYTTGLSDQLQEKAIDERGCTANPTKRECRLTAVNLTRNDLYDDQLARLQFAVAPEITFVPFRGKIALFSALFVDTDINIFLGPAVVGLQERAECGRDTEGARIDANPTCAAQSSFVLENRVTVAPTFGLGLNFYPTSIFGFGAEWRGLPYEWNTSGFDNAGGGPDGEFPDNNVNGADREFKFNSLITVNFIFRFPDLELSE